MLYFVTPFQTNLKSQTFPIRLSNALVTLLELCFVLCIRITFTVNNHGATVAKSAQ